MAAMQSLFDVYRVLSLLSNHKKIPLTCTETHKEKTYNTCYSNKNQIFYVSVKIYLYILIINVSEMHLNMIYVFLLPYFKFVFLRVSIYFVIKGI